MIDNPTLFRLADGIYILRYFYDMKMKTDYPKQSYIKMAFVIRGYEKNKFNNMLYIVSGVSHK